LLLLCVGGYFALRGGAARAPEAVNNVAPPPSVAPAPTAAPSETAPPADSAPAEVASASEDAPPSTAADTHGRAAAPTRPASLAKTAEPAKEPPKEPAKVAESAAPSASAAPTAPAAPVYPALVGQFMNRVGPQFRLLRVTATLDGQTVYSGPGGAFTEIFRKMPPPGEHNVSVVAEYQGNGSGVFSYFDGYKFSVRGAKTFTSKADAPTQVTIAATEKGGVTTPFPERLSLMVNVR
jgi:hypothetical protein